MASLEIDRTFFDAVLRAFAVKGENATVGASWGGCPYPHLEEAHKNLVRESVTYRKAFDQYKTGYLKIDDLMTKGSERVPDFNRDASELDQWKGIALAAFHVAVLLSRIPRTIGPLWREVSAAQKMFDIYKASRFGPQPAPAGA